ncbi:hypothetical protein Glove_718g30 [Diversispora epigaea]|uniref:BTB domain-containing protein n=1 Tax=Diversispora epigaea TaxID=1348612 RepID=A0A397G405_9GLOM|nr:hypothetical protein Glove_718g30 [Diversispora epigaea]
MKTRGSSLVKDLGHLINNPIYSDLRILSEDKVILYGCRSILAARSVVLDRLLFNGMKETKQNEIKFPEIKADAIKIILEFLYTGEINELDLTPENVIDAFHAADYFQLIDLQDYIVEFIKKALPNSKNYNNNNNIYIYNYNYNNNDDDGNDDRPKFSAPILLSKAVKKMSASAENNLIKLLTKHVALIPLDIIKSDKLSFQALQCLLYKTLDTDEPFATPEYMVFRHAVIKAAKCVSGDAVSLFEKRLPIKKKFNENNDENNDEINYENNKNHEKNDDGGDEYDDYDENDQLKYEEIKSTVMELFSSVLPYIDLNRIDTDTLINIIEPLEIIPINILLGAYRFKAQNKTALSPLRGIPLYKWDLYWDPRVRGLNLILHDNNQIVESSNIGQNVHHSVRANKIICEEGIYEWDVILEENCTYAWIGVCAERGLDYSSFAGQQSCAWVLGSSGKCYHNSIGFEYTKEFGSGTRITVHLNMTRKTIAFSINGVRHPEITAWLNLPSRLYPVVSLRPPGRIRFI